MDDMVSGAGVFFSPNFVRCMDWPSSSTRGLTQIWLHVREESRNFVKLCYILATSSNLLCKSGNFKKKKKKSSKYGGHMKEALNHATLGDIIVLGGKKLCNSLLVI
jgi:hypothetical protein